MSGWDHLQLALRGLMVVSILQVLVSLAGIVAYLRRKDKP